MGRALTPRTQLESLRKEAKRWLKAVRAGDAKALARLKAAWPKAPAEPSLRDLQQALARDYGQESWIALKAALDDLALGRRSEAERVEIVLRHGWGGDPRLARRILERHPEIARFDLFTAATCGDLAEVERRLARDPEAARKTGGPLNWTALACVAYGRLDPVNGPAIARLLLDAGADPNWAFDDGWGNAFKPVTGAIGLGEGAKPSHPQAVELVELLIAAGADPYEGQALYDISIVGDDLDWYELLWRRCEAAGRLEAWRVPGEDRLGGGKGQSTLDYLLSNAVGQNNLARTEWLLQHGADPNARHYYTGDPLDETTGRPLHALAQLSGHLEMAALLERHGARPAALKGIEAFQAACLRHDAAEARALAAAEPSMTRDPHPLLTAAMQGDAEAVALMLDLGWPMDGADPHQITPLHRAVQSGSLETVRRLIDAGANPDRRERRWGGSAMTWSQVLGQPHIGDFLEPLTRDPRALAWQGRTTRLAELLDAEPDLVNLRPADAHDAPTPLFCLPDDEAAAVEVTRLLLARGADPKARNAKGQTPAEMARRRELDEAAELMEAKI
ncbi:MAG: ankyrin repeat domain-containing protein [Proteobacteria bacterium]|nr:ankyrin repeat domain-containing protein [Pseudomonadota bacterium]